MRTRTIFFLMSMLGIFSLTGRSPYRVPDPLDPLVTVQTSNNPHTIFRFCESHLHDIIFKLYDEPFCYQHLLPTSLITYRYEPKKGVEGSVLNALIQEAVDTILTNKKGRGLRFKNFVILKARDVNRAHTAGLFILKFKDFPFVLKLFIETPSGLFRPGDKGFEPLCFYYMSGGVSRHLSGFTRLKNMHNVALLTQQDPYWSTRVSFPRKWFWLPADPTWLLIEGERIGPFFTNKTKIPAIYGVVCDEIVWKHPFSMSNHNDRQEALALSNFLNHRIDLHINNFGIEKQSNLLVLIDFEHFPSFVGLCEKKECANYWQWYRQLACKMIHDTLGRNKKIRRQLQQALYQPDTPTILTTAQNESSDV